MESVSAMPVQAQNFRGGMLHINQWRKKDDNYIRAMTTKSSVIVMDWIKMALIQYQGGDKDIRWLADFLFYGNDQYQLEYGVGKSIVIPQWLHLPRRKATRSVGNSTTGFST